MWVRGLKLIIDAKIVNNIRSHPMWVRGLKLTGRDKFEATEQSHPMWVRGLKLLCYNIIYLHKRRTLCGCVD